MRQMDAESSSALSTQKEFPFLSVTSL